MAEKIPGSPHPRSRGARRRPSDPVGSGGLDRRQRPSMPPGTYEGRQGSLTLRRALAAAAALGWASTGAAPAGLTASASAERPTPPARLDCPDPSDGPPAGDGGDGRKGLFIVGFSALVSILLFVMGGDEGSEADVEDDKNDPPIRL